MLFFTLVSIILFYFCLYLFFDNKNLKEKVKKLEEDTKIILERKIISSKDDIVSVENISVCDEKNNEEGIEKSSTIKNEKVKVVDDFDFVSYKDRKYVARTNDEEVIIPNIPKPTSSSLVKEQKEEIKKITTFKDNVSISLDFNDFVKSDVKVKENVEVNGKDYLEEIAKKIEKELAPQTVELTDYEKEQEENAVISYKELLSLKDKVNATTNKSSKESNKTLLEELKMIRSMLDNKNI